MPLHIGVVGCSAEGAALCYRTICAEGPSTLGEHAHPEITIHTPSLAEYVRHLDNGDLESVARLMLASAQKLESAGADFLICPDNTIHQAFNLVEPVSPLPWLHIAQVVAESAAATGFGRVGIMGTHWLTKSSVYPDALAAVGISAVVPATNDIDDMGRIIMQELVGGRFIPRSIDRLRAIIDRFGADGCDAVVLGCTELPLVLDSNNCTLPILDSTRILARAALARAAMS